MAITPPADIVLDVARAADPDKYRAAVERLARLRETAPSTAAFTVPAASPPASASVSAPAASATRALDVSNIAQSRRQLDAYGQFEAFVLQTFVQSMLPKDATNVFGKGSAGEFWKSMLAEKMGDELARSGQVGIARQLASPPSHPARPEATATLSPSALPPPLASTLGALPPASADPVQSVDEGVVPAAPVSERG